MRTGVCLAVVLGACGGSWQARQVVPFVTTPEPVAAGMLQLASVGPGDVVYDLGCGDGRLLLAAVAGRGARGLGVELDPELVAASRRTATSLGVSDRARFVQADLFEVDLRPASAVMMYLLYSVNMRLRPKLLRELAPGARVVSHRFSMGDAWPPDRRASFGDGDERKAVFAWTVPAGAGGLWRCDVDGRQLELPVHQRFQMLGSAGAVLRGRVTGDHLEVDVDHAVAGCASARVEGRLAGSTLTGTLRCGDEPARTLSCERGPRARLLGTWRWRHTASGGEVTATLVLGETGAALTARLDTGQGSQPLTDVYRFGDSVYVSVLSELHDPLLALEGTVTGDRLDGVVRDALGRVAPFTAARAPGE